MAAAGERRCLGVLLFLAGCSADPILAEGEFGRPISLASGDASPLPRLTFVDEGCPGTEAVGGCPSADDDRRCRPLLIDTLNPLTVLKRVDDEDAYSFGRECLEVRASAGLSSSTPSDEALDAAVTRFRFRDLPLTRAPIEPSEVWTWNGGLGDLSVEVDGVLGGNVLNDFAIEIRSPGSSASVTPRPSVSPTEGATVALYPDFPGTDRALADEGRAHLPVQFPGQLLGSPLSDRCDIDGRTCELDGLDPEGRPATALEDSLFVVDACLATPPCALVWEPGECRMSPGPADDAACDPADAPGVGGRAASLVVATGVIGVVLYADSFSRMFGDPESLPGCENVVRADHACVEGRAGTLRVPGWPPAGDPDEGDALLWQARVRNLALAPGLDSAQGPGPCARVGRRWDALLAQCQTFEDVRDDAASDEDTTPPYRAPPETSGANSPSNASLAVLGETRWTDTQTSPDPRRWLPTLILPAEHPLARSVRRWVAPDAIEPDGLLGTALFQATTVVLDAADGSPNLRLSCLEPQSGECLVAPPCSEDGQAACCFGLPLPLLSEFILQADSTTCCSALSASELAEVQAEGRCLRVQPP